MQKRTKPRHQSSTPTRRQIAEALLELLPQDTNTNIANWLTVTIYTPELDHDLTGKEIHDLHWNTAPTAQTRKVPIKSATFGMWLTHTKPTLAWDTALATAIEPANLDL